MYYFASDVHLNASTVATAREVESRFLAWLERVAPTADAIFLVGDIFDFWFEYKQVIPKGYTRTLGRLAELTDRGVRIVFLVGNHDMWVGDYLEKECGVELYTTPQIFDLGAHRVYLAHGDNLNIRQKPLLKAMNWAFRSRTMKWLFSTFVHPNLAIRFGRWWSSLSRKGHNNRPPAELSITSTLIEYAKEHSEKSGVQSYVFGHMHTARNYCEGGLKVINLGCWAERESYATMDSEGNFELY